MKELNYNLVGDYYFPDLKGNEPLPTLSKFGRILLKHLKENHQGHYFSLRANNQLNDYLTKMDKQMNERYDLLIEQYKEKEGITEELKAKDQMKWVQEMNRIRLLVECIVKDEYV